MNEIDFDELDRAVSSLMNKNQKRSDDSVKTELGRSPAVANDTVPTPVDEPQAVAYNTTEPDSGSKDDRDSSQKPELSSDHTDPTQPDDYSRNEIAMNPNRSRTVPHRAGRFMDVKHDSSSMRSSTPSVSRQGATLQPMSESPEDTMTEPDENDTPAPAATDDTHDNIAQAKPADVGVSPFLTDAKVEKRPLGRPKKEAPNEDVDGASKNPEPADEIQPDESVASSELDSDEPVGMPEELQPDLVSIEADTDTEAVPAPEDDQPVQESEDKKPKVDLVKELGGTPELESLEDSSASIDSDTPAAPVSIPQQYKESPSSQPQNSGTIYDTENYHQPISHPAKKSSGWMIVVWIVLIIVLGASLGIAAYFSGLI